MFMERALSIAECGRGRTSPNPIVGALVVSAGGVVVGHGAHLSAGGPHAEIHALDEAGSRAQGATLYATLEPCCHVGRTGPCVERIASAGIARVVAAVRDPNPRVAGKGFDYLRAHGIQVDEGVGQDVAVDQNRPFFTWITSGRPFVVLKTAVSRDGFVGRPHERVKLTGEAADRWFQRQRAEIDAIAVGSETMLTDDPLLTSRDVFRHRPLTRVIFDRRARVPPTARLFSTLQAGPVIIVVASASGADRAHESRVEVLAAAGAVIERVDGQGLSFALRRLADRGVLSLLVEGGPALQSAFVREGFADRIQCVTVPVELEHGVPMAPMGALVSGEPRRVLELGQDTLREFDVHRTR
jgi:diaminohydroxyphosphoribosylaminopyrimidine deaminase/5-amino-6-(5-phosphoribosylamino)uracil reductase